MPWDQLNRWDAPWVGWVLLAIGLIWMRARRLTSRNAELTEAVASRTRDLSATVDQLSAQRAQLHQREQYRGHRGDQRAHVGHVVQQEGQQPPHHRVIHADHQQHQGHRGAGGRADQGFQAHVVLDAGGDLLKGAQRGFVFAHGAFHLVMQHQSFAQQKGCGQQYQEGISHFKIFSKDAAHHSAMTVVATFTG